ncbi:MAG TPA: aminotransferase class V-fold PLP-dependent enzyme [Acidimicrobiales bacterium]|nr:aminotransferase class V-fold PLP-dependent enzyme [Acidimicrobiales bacterium]
MTSENQTSGGGLVQLVGDEMTVPCIGRSDRRYVSLDAAASTSAHPGVARRVEDFLPIYSSVHRGAGFKSQASTDSYEAARNAALCFAGKQVGAQLAPAEQSQNPREDSTAIICRNTTEAINHLAFRLNLTAADTVVTTVVEHHANLLPWRRYATCRYVECAEDGTFTPDDVVSVLSIQPRPRLLAITAASNITGWMPDLGRIIEEAHRLGIPVLVDAAQLVAHRPIPAQADFVVWSGHKMYAPFGAGVLIGPKEQFRHGEPFLAGGGAVDLVDLDQVVWTEPPEREEAGSPNVLGAVALHAAIDELTQLGWSKIREHDDRIGDTMRAGLDAIRGVNVLGPSSDQGLLPVCTFTVEGVAHGLVAARLSAEFGIGVRHGCFCAHPYLTRLLHLSAEQLWVFRQQVMRKERHSIPGAVRASAGLSTSQDDIEYFLSSLEQVASGSAPPVSYIQDQVSGEFFPDPEVAPWYASGLARTACGRS